jgi:hypothetical protein
MKWSITRWRPSQSLPGSDFFSVRHGDDAMKIEQGITYIIGRLMGRMLRRILAIAVLALIILVALYHLTIAGTLALEGLYGPLDAHLIVAGIYATLAVIIFVYLFATRAKAPAVKSRAHSSRRAPQDVRIAELLESILLGYTLARRKSRSS